MNRRRRHTAASDYRTPAHAGPGLTATLNSDDSITLTWSAPDDGSVTSYHILLRRPKEGEETRIVYVSDMGNTGTDLDPRYGYHVKAKNAHGLSNVSNFATRFLSGNTASATMCHVHGPHRSTHQHPEKRCASPLGCATRRRYSRFTARLTVAGDTTKDLAARRWLTPLATISMAAASCFSINRRGAPSYLPSVFACSKPALVRLRQALWFRILAVC